MNSDISRAVNVLIIGQGVSGTMLSWYLEKAGISHIVVDDAKPTAASKAAAGIINPVTGRRIVKTWMIDTLLPFVRDTYQQIGKELGVKCISQKDIIDFFPSPQMRIAFQQRYEEDQSFLQNPDDESAWNEFFNYDFGFGIISPAYLVDMVALLPAYRERLITRNQLIEESFDISQLVVEENKISYKYLSADKIIFCDGLESTYNPYFKNLPFAPNKGEVLILESNELPSTHIFKKGMTLAPLGNQLFWVGSTYEWDFKDDQPTEFFRTKTEALLTTWLKLPFKTMDHIAAVRPATLERRPFAGFHPLQKNIGILNGMGAKGCSLAPYFASQLAQEIAGHPSLSPEADIVRFRNMLSR